MTANARKRTSGLSPVLSRKASDTTSAAAAPSVIWEELPAVMVPSALKAGFSLASAATLVSARTPSSSATTSLAQIILPFTSEQDSASTGMISSANFPCLIASAAFWWLAAAKASWSSREMPYFCATSSPVIPMEAKVSGQDETSEGLALNLLPPMGIMVMLSEPPATMQSAKPAMIRSAAEAMVCSPEEQKRFTVWAGTW